MALKAMDSSCLEKFTKSVDRGTIEGMFILKVAAVLDKYQVPYALVGGYAVALHGAVRGTIDIDLITAWSLENLRLVKKALGEVGLVPRLPVTLEDLFQFRDEYIKNKNMMAWNFINPDNSIEQVDVIITVDRENVSVCHIEVGGRRLPVIGKKDLIVMKREAGRLQDIADAEALEKLDED